MNRPSKPWASEVVYLRGLGILSVLFLHTATKLQSLYGPQGLTGPWYLELAAAWLTGIPAFIFASGFVMGLSSKGSGRDWRQFYLRRAQAILPPYIFFTAVYYLYFKSAGRPPLEWPVRILANVIRGDSAAHMWFVVSIFQMYLLLPVFERILDAAKAKRRIPHVLAASAILQLTWTIAFPPLLVQMTGGTMDPGVARQISWRFFPFSIFMFLSGLAAAKNRDSFIGLLKYAPATMLLGVHVILGLAYTFLPAALTEGGVNTTLRFILRLTSLGIYFQWSLGMAKVGGHAVSRAVGLFGQYAYGIYLAHVLVEDLLLNALFGMGLRLEQVSVVFPLVFLTTASITFTAVRLAARLPGSAYLIGQTEGRAPRNTPSTG